MHATLARTSVCMIHRCKTFSSASSALPPAASVALRLAVHHKYGSHTRPMCGWCLWQNIASCFVFLHSYTTMVVGFAANKIPRGKECVVQWSARSRLMHCVCSDRMCIGLTAAVARSHVGYVVLALDIQQRHLAVVMSDGPAFPVRSDILAVWEVGSGYL